MIDFVARLFGLSSHEAAKKLAHDFGIDPDKPPAAAALGRPEYPLAQSFRRDSLCCQRVLCSYLHLLEGWKERYSPVRPEDGLDDRFVEACQMLDYVEYLLDVLMFAELEQRVKAVDMLMKDGAIAALERRLHSLDKEVAPMAKNEQPREMPVWFDGKSINEALFCDDFLSRHKIIYTNGAFFHARWPCD